MASVYLLPAIVCKLNQSTDANIMAVDLGEGGGKVALVAKNYTDFCRNTVMLLKDQGADFPNLVYYLWIIRFNFILLLMLSSLFLSLSVLVCTKSFKTSVVFVLRIWRIVGAHLSLPTYTCSQNSWLDIIWGPLNKIETYFYSPSYLMLDFIVFIFIIAL